MNLPDEVLNAMADAMLDPPLRRDLISEGARKVRIRVLSRALAAAEEMGWWVMPVPGPHDV